MSYRRLSLFSGLPGLLVLVLPILPSHALLESGLLLSTALGSPSEAAREASDVGAGSLPSHDLMIIMPSHANDADSRLAVRATWGQYLNKSAINCTQCANHNVKILFVIGSEGNKTEIDKEVKQNSDVGVLEDFRQPAYGSDSEMTQRAIRYAVEHFKFKLLMKVDLHSWVFMDRLLDFLDDDHLFALNVSSPGIYAGNFNTPRHPALIDGSAADAVFYKQTGTSIYPKHAQGAGFLLTPDLCEFISGMGAPSEDTSGAPKWGDEYGWAPVPRLASLPSEEVSVAFWLVPVNHTKLHMPIAIGMEACTGNPSDPVVVDHGMEGNDMKERWQNLIKTGDPCRVQPPASFFKRGRQTVPRPSLKTQRVMTASD